MSNPLLTLSLTPTQAAALARVGEQSAELLAEWFPDGRHRSAAVRAFDRIADAIEGLVPDAFDLDLERFADVHARLKSAEMAELLRVRVRDLLAAAVLWVAVESIPGIGDAEGLLGVPAIDDIEWRAEVLELLQARGIAVVLPGE